MSDLPPNLVGWGATHSRASLITDGERKFIRLDIEIAGVWGDSGVKLMMARALRAASLAVDNVEKMTVEGLESAISRELNTGDSISVYKP